MTIAATVYAEHAAGLAEAERQIAFLESAGPNDIAAVIAVLATAADEDADPRIVLGVRALQRIYSASRGHTR